MVTRITRNNGDGDDYTCEDARRFDPVLREHGGTAARFLFTNAQRTLAAGATYENVEFDTECDKSGAHHTSACRIRLVTVRRRSDGPNGEDVVSAFPHRIGEAHMESIRRAHNLVYQV